MEWPRIPLPGYPNGGDANAFEKLRQSAERGRKLAALLDPETSVAGITQAPLRPEVVTIAIPTTANERNMTEEDFALTAGWGHYGQGDAVMPGQGRAMKRTFTTGERDKISDPSQALGKTTYDIHLNANAFWRNVPAAVWNYRLGGYQVLKKWLSYREQDVLGRPLKLDEVQHFTNTARRIAEILRLTTSKA